MTTKSKPEEKALKAPNRLVEETPTAEVPAETGKKPAVEPHTHPEVVLRRLPPAEQKKRDAAVKAALDAAPPRGVGTPGYRKPRPRGPAPDAKVTARQYIRIRGVKWESAAGFAFAAMKKYGRAATRTREQWAADWDAFFAAPAK
jgi:hypothetical protein